MRRFERSMAVASGIEFTFAAIWILATLAGFALGLVAAQQAPAGSPVGGGLLFVFPLGALGAFPSVMLGFMFRSDRRSHSRSRAAMLLGLFFGLPPLALTAWLAPAFAQFMAGAPGDYDFLVIGGLVLLTGLAHLAAGGIAWWGRRGVRGEGRDVRPPAGGAVATPGLS